MDAGRRGLPVDRLVRGGGAALLGRLLDRGFRRGELVACRCRIPCTIRRRGRDDSLGERHTGVRLVQRQERPASTAPDSGGRTSRGRAAPGIRSRLVGQPDRTVPRPDMRTCHRPVVENRTDPVLGWLWVPTTLLSAFGADIRSQAREFSWAWNQWTGLDQPYIGFFSFVPMDIYPTAHYIWPSNPTYLTDQHNIVLTVLYGAVLSVSRYFTDSNDVGFVVLSSAQFLFAAFCCAATANRFFNLPWLPRRAGIDFTHPERGPMALVMLDFAHPERGYASPGFTARACAGNGRLPEGASGWFSRLVIILFFLCCPLAVFSTISLTKSPLFAFSFVWAFGVWYELFRTWRGKGDKVVRLRRRSLIALILACVVMLASAKYAWYIIVLQLILALLSDHRRWKAYVVALLLPVIVLHGGVVMLTRTGAIISGDPIESHGVQLQQIARIAKRNPGSIPQSAREEIAPIFNLDQMADAYQPQDADPVKSSGIQSKKVSYRWRSVTQEDMARFNSAWWQIVKADPVTAIDALLAKCFGYFNPMDQPYVSMDYYVNSDYVTDQTTWIKYWCSEWRQSIAEGAKQFGEIPVLGWVAHGNLYVMMTLLIGAAEVGLRRWRTLVMHLPLLLLIGRDDHRAREQFRAAYAAGGVRVWIRGAHVLAGVAAGAAQRGHPVTTGDACRRFGYAGRYDRFRHGAWFR